jgi:hypothetical protein
LSVLTAGLLARRRRPGTATEPQSADSNWSRVERAEPTIREARGML